METVLQIIGAIIAVVVIVFAAVFFGIPGWVVPDRKPNKETINILAVILTLILFIVIGAVIWEMNK